VLPELNEENVEPFNEEEVDSLWDAYNNEIK
jgi:hypothetical protein